MRSWMIAAILGISCVGLWSSLPENIIFLWVALPISIVLTKYYRNAILIIPAALGISWGITYGNQITGSIIPNDLEGKEVLIEGQVLTIPKIDSRKTSFQILVSKSPYEQLENRKIKLSWYHGPSIRAGQYYQLLVKLKRPRGLQNPGGFDYESWLIRNQIVGVGYVRNSKQNLQLVNDVDSFIAYRQSLANKLDLSTKDLSFRRIIFALAIGESQYLTQDDWALLQDTGTIHLMVISGLHIGLAAWFGFILFAGLSRVSLSLLAVLPSQKWGLVGGLLLAAMYAALAGFSLPTQRALTMIIMSFLCLFLMTRIQIADLMLAALFVVIALDPLSIFANGFWLSFGAVIVLIYGVGNRLQLKKNITLKIKVWIHAQWVIFIGLMPALILLTHQISLISPIANFIAVAAIGFITVPSILTALILTAFNLPNSWPLEVADISLTLIWRCLNSLQELAVLVEAVGFNAKPVNSAIIFGLLFAILGCLILLAPTLFRGMKVVGILCLSSLFIKSSNSPPNGIAQINILDVGQGLAIYIETENHALLYDTGKSYSSSFDAASASIIPFLQYKGRTQLDRLIISHHDMDHIGGANSLLKDIDVGTLISSSEPKQFSQLEWLLCRGDLKWEWDGVKFEFIHPTDKLPKKANNQSCVLKVTAANASLLIAGDIEKGAEQHLVTNLADKLDVDVLVAPHHGSKTSSSLGFIKAASPSWVIFSAGYRSQFKHPHQKVVQRYSAHKVNALNTADAGMISFVLDTPITPFKYRDQKQGYW